MNPNRWIQLVALSLTLWCVAGIVLVGGRIDRERRELGLSQTANASKAPQDVALTTVVAAGSGVFRGVAISFAWYRANKMQEAGQYQEANTLAEWITTLEPHYPAVWVFQAWNMAYNISVKTYTPEERWNWVNKGIMLLRDRGIPVYNPKSVTLYKELGWIFFHKIGMNSDDMHWYYKRELARQWQEILGTPPAGGTQEEYLAPMRAVAEAPDTEAALRAAQPQVEPLLKALAEIGYVPGPALLHAVGRAQMFRTSQDAAVMSTARQEELRRLYDQRLVALMDRPAYAGAWPVLTAYLRKVTLRDEFHMDPVFMYRLMQPENEKNPAQGGYGFGPVDWRHPAAHSLYWAAMGTRVAGEVKGNEKIDLLNTYRSVVHSLQALTYAGRVSFDPVSGYVDLLPDPRFIPAYEKAWELAVQDVLKGGYSGDPKQSYQAGHENFLLSAIQFSYLYGAPEQAAAYYRRARELYGNRPENIQKGRYNGDLEDLVMRELTENVDRLEFTRQFIDSMLLRGMQVGLANGRLDTYEHFEGLARRAHARLQARAVATPIAPQNRMALLPFDQTVAETYLNFMRAPTVPLLVRVRVWRNTPLTLQQRVYDRLRPILVPQCEAAGFDPTKAFPEPVGMDMYRKMQPATPATPSTDSPVGIERN